MLLGVSEASSGNTFQDHLWNAFVAPQDNCVCASPWGVRGEDHLRAFRILKELWVLGRSLRKSSNPWDPLEGCGLWACQASLEAPWRSWGWGPAPVLPHSLKVSKVYNSHQKEGGERCFYRWAKVFVTSGAKVFVIGGQKSFFLLGTSDPQRAGQPRARSTPVGQPAGGPVGAAVGQTSVLPVGGPAAAPASQLTSAPAGRPTSAQAGQPADAPAG